MRYLLVLLMLFFASTSFISYSYAVSRIDDIEIDELHDELTVVGKFGPDRGEVFVDEQPCPIVQWSTTAIHCTIPHDGKGSCGPVIVISNGERRNARILTAYDITMEVHKRATDGTRSVTHDETRLMQVRIRADLEPAYHHVQVVPFLMALRDSAGFWSRSVYGPQNASGYSESVTSRFGSSDSVDVQGLTCFGTIDPTAHKMHGMVMVDAPTQVIRYSYSSDNKGYHSSRDTTYGRLKNQFSFAIDLSDDLQIVRQGGSFPHYNSEGFGGAYYYVDSSWSLKGDMQFPPATSSSSSPSGNSMFDVALVSVTSDHLRLDTALSCRAIITNEIGQQIDERQLDHDSQLDLPSLAIGWYQLTLLLPDHPRHLRFVLP